jgi:hypothetical protein
MVIPGSEHGSTATQVEKTIVQEVGDVTVTVVLKGDLFPHGKNLLLALRRIGSIGTVETVFVLKGKQRLERLDKCKITFFSLVSNHIILTR